MIRPWTADDTEPSYAVYVDAVLNGAAGHYTEAQRRAWVPSERMEDWWQPRLAADIAWVSEDEDGLTGVIAMQPGGHLDLFFVVPRARGDGTATALYDRFLSEVRTRGIGCLTTHASDYLKPFLERRGWRTVEEELVDRFGVTIRRWAMALDQVPGSQVS
ncbi:GNAT family N-acetyltransferase [Alphaproteobacteria bacterium GH1-50]|uniref:GNAT family N-acetyltransferase n=1 Tax=Kangsaoukella pontilimi TaxID=2691042 RepID=A0A7C9NCG4_9RHOB|nr:GNAT family N-acetyltransferase [Kangsaoukella pontilimi]MXQ06659.1 GNAT family N-acetyltransferase [Kangsaoukella pontilimi]